MALLAQRTDVPAAIMTCRTDNSVGGRSLEIAARRSAVQRPRSSSPLVACLMRQPGYMILSGRTGAAEPRSGAGRRACREEELVYADCFADIRWGFDLVVQESDESVD